MQPRKPRTRVLRKRSPWRHTHACKCDSQISHDRVAPSSRLSKVLPKLLDQVLKVRSKIEGNMEKLKAMPGEAAKRILWASNIVCACTVLLESALV